MMRRLLSVVAVLVVLGALGWLMTRPRAFIPGEETAPTQSPVPRRSLPDLTFTDYNGQTVRLRDLRGTPLVVNSWAAWCPFCEAELRDFAGVQEEFGARVKIIAVDRAESLETARAFTNKLGVTEKLLYLLDPEDEFYRAIGGFAMPETLFVGADGTIAFHKRGVMSRAEIRQRVVELRNEGGP